MLVRFRVAPFIWALLLGLACSSTPADGDGVVDASEELGAVVDAHLEGATNVLGTIVKVDIGGTKSYQASRGFIDASRVDPLEPGTNVVAGSVTKLFTAALVHQLTEQGLVQLERPAVEYLSADWSAVLRETEYGDEITVAHLLSHRSGLADVTNSESFQVAVYTDPTNDWGALDVLRMVQQEEAEFAPGESFSYSNTNYILLGGLIEQVSGVSYRQLLQERILDRIELEDTTLVEGSYGEFEGVIARGYSEIGDVSGDGGTARVEWAHAAGGIISTADDLIAFYRALVSGDLFEEPDTYERMCQLVGHNVSYGLGVEIVDDSDIGLYYGHRGNFMGTRTILAYFPEERMTIMVCHTYDGFSLSHPVGLMKRIVRGIRGDAPADEMGVVLEGPELLSDTTNLVQSEDSPALGEWDFEPTEEWRLDKLGFRPLRMVGDIRVDEDGFLFLLERGSATIAVVDPDGNLVRSFGGRGDGPNLEYPVGLLLSPNHVHVVDFGHGGDKIKTFDKRGDYVGATEVGRGVSLRGFIDDDRYLTVRGGPDVLDRTSHELLEITSRSEAKATALAKFPAEEKLILEVMVPRGRYLFLEDDIDVFPRLILHLDGDMLLVGRSDEYLIQRVDLRTGEQQAITIVGREGVPLPAGHAAAAADGAKVAGEAMDEKTRRRFLERYPDRQTLFTKIATDDRGLLYVSVPDVTNPGLQRMDVFSPEGQYLYRAALRLPEGFERIRPLELVENQLYGLVRDPAGAVRLIKYRVRVPPLPQDWMVEVTPGEEVGTSPLPTGPEVELTSAEAPTSPE